MEQLDSILDREPPKHDEVVHVFSINDGWVYAHYNTALGEFYSHNTLVNKRLTDVITWRDVPKSFDPMNLDRFATAHAKYLHTIKAELKAGAKKSCWAWYIFPQIKGLGRSEKAEYYAISSLLEAYHFILNNDLRYAYQDVIDLILLNQRTTSTTLVELLGSEIDVLKLHASLTLFRLTIDALSPELEKPVWLSHYNGIVDNALCVLFDSALHEKTVEIVCSEK